MKSVLTLFLSLVIFVGGLMPHNDVEELSKIPYLIEHYQYHQTMVGGTLSVGQFLRMHYLATCAGQRVAAAPEHDKLPFLGQHHFPDLEYIVPAPAPVVPLNDHAAWPEGAYRAAIPPLYSYALHEALFQPPRA